MTTIREDLSGYRWLASQLAEVDSGKARVMHDLIDEVVRLREGLSVESVVTASREGPKITVSRSCVGCVHNRSEYYAVQGDSGHLVSCAHPSHQAPRQIGDTRWDTPEWCPVSPRSREGR